MRSWGECCDSRAPAGSRPDEFLAGPRLAYDGHARHGTFDLADFGAIARSYTIGGPDVAIQYGSRASTPRNVTPGDPGHDFGDYGIVHEITFTLVNPTDAPSLVYLYEKPLGGPVRSSFFVDGELKELGCVRLAQPYWVATYQLAPHSTGLSTTITMTGGGPSKATETLVYKVFFDGRLGGDLGGSAVQSVFLMIIVIGLTTIQFRYVERKVQY